MRKKYIILGGIISAGLIFGGCQNSANINKVINNTNDNQTSVQQVNKDKNSDEKASREKLIIDSRGSEQLIKNNKEKIMNNQTINKEKDNSLPIDIDLAKTCKIAVLKTSMGDIKIELFGDKAPTTVANFCTLAKKGFYDRVKFHRVIDGFMIQTGDPKSKDNNLKDAWGTGDPGYKFKDELPQAGEYKIGSVAMANSGPNTNGSQFFIVTGQSGVGLPPLYSLFGQVTKGLEIIEKIQKVDTEEKGIKDRPVEAVVVNKIVIGE